MAPALSMFLLLIVMAIVNAEVVSDEVRDIQEMIEENGLRWRAGQTSMMDLSPEERRLRLGAIFPEELRLMFEALDELPPPLLTNTQPLFDWRALNGVTPIKDQGNCGSCWDFAGTAAFESAYLIAEHIVPDFSEQAVLSCNADGNDCNGGQCDNVFNFFINRGAVDESCMPYQADDTVPCTMDECDIIAYLQSYSPVPNNVDAIKNSLTMGPVTTYFCVFDDFNGYSDGCYEHDFNYGDPLNHAVLIVGWDDNMCDGEGAWIVKNSWNENWGDDGFFYMKYNSSGIGNGVFMPIYQYSGMGEIQVSVDSIQVDLQPGEQIEEVIEISNMGDGELRYHIDCFSESDQDEFGYYWRDNDDPDGPVYNWVGVTDDGQTVDFWGYDNDGNSGQIDLGFDFDFYGNTCDEITICTNGWISFNSAFILEWNNQEIPSMAQPNNMVAAFFDDLNLEYGGEVYYYTNDNDSAIITWDHVPDSRQEGIFTFQIILAAPSTIVFQYNSMGPGRLDECSIGIENRFGSVGTQVVYNNNYVYDELAIKFIPGDAPPPMTWLIADPVDGLIPGYDQQYVGITFDATDLPPGIFCASLAIMSNCIENPSVIIPVTLTSLVTDIEKNEASIPGRFQLHPVYPNPLNPEASINYSIPQAADITVEVYDLLGRKVASLFDGYQPAGDHSLLWRPDNQASGVYLIKLSSGDITRTEKVTLLR